MSHLVKEQIKQRLLQVSRTSWKCRMSNNVKSTVDKRHLGIQQAQVGDPALS